MYFLMFQSYRTYTKQQRHPVNCNSCSWCGCGHSNFQIDSCRLAWGFIDRLSQNHWRHMKQEAQLWQRDCAKLGTFSINVQRYSQNHGQNWIFGPPHGGHQEQLIYALYLKFLTKRNLVAEFHLKNVSFTRTTANYRFWVTLFRGRA